MSTSARLFRLSLAVALAVTAACQEKIPEGPTRGQVLSAHLYTTFGQTSFPQPPDFADRYELSKVSAEDMRLLTFWRVPFRIEVENVFDETIDGTKWIQVTLKLWPREGGRWTKTLTYADTASGESLVIHPGHTYVVSAEEKLIWDQTDDQGQSVHQYESYELTVVRRRIVTLRMVEPTTREKKLVMWMFCDTLGTVTKDSLVAFHPPLAVKAKAQVQLFREYPPLETDELELRIFYLFPRGMRNKYWCAEGPFGEGG